MAQKFRSVIGRILLAALAVTMAGILYISILGAPSELIFWKIFITAITLVVCLICTITSALTLDTRYKIVGFLGVAASFVTILITVPSILLFSFPTAESIMSEPDPSPSPVTELMQTTPSSLATGDFSFLTGLILSVALLTLALPLINVVLYFGYESNLAGEIAGPVTALLIVITIATYSSSVVSTSSSEEIQQNLMILMWLTVAGIIATPVASRIEGNGLLFSPIHEGRSPRGTVHYDIPSGYSPRQAPVEQKPSALPSSFQPPTGNRYDV